MKLLVLCLLFGAVLALTRADPPETKPNNEVEDPSVDEKDVAEPESVEETELSEAEDEDSGERAEDPDVDEEDIAEPESVDETELTEDEQEESGQRVKRSRCRPGYWCRYRRRIYVYIPTARRWGHAQSHCLALGGTLATVHNRAVNNFLKRLARRRPAWIGYSDAQQERYWFWINGKQTRYTNWCRGEPNNYRGRPQNCALINWTRRKCWDDQRCTNRKPYICERK